MKIIDRIFGGIKKVVNREVKVKEYNTGWTNLMSGYNARSYEMYASYAYAAINARAENIAKARIYLQRKTKGRKKSEYEEVTEHSFLDAINNPNVFNQSFEIMLFMISVSLDIYGNAYLLVSRKPKSESNANAVYGEPDMFYFLPFKNVRPIMDENNRSIKEYEYTEGNKIYKIPERDVIHFIVPSPYSNTMGKSLASAFNYTLDIDYYQNLFQKSFYINNASIGLILEYPENMNDEQFERIETKLEQKYTGVDKSGKPLILEGGLKASAYKPSVKDVEMLPSRKMIRDEILAIFRVPKVILGILEDVNYAASKEAFRIFNEYTIRPFAKICIESKINLFLRENYKNEELRISMEYEFETDRALQLKAFEIYRKYDIVSVEEIREIEGFGKIKN